MGGSDETREVGLSSEMAIIRSGIALELEELFD
jgi:hypothetical protein